MPNQAARTLKGAPTRMIGFIIPDIADLFFQLRRGRAGRRSR
jgi:DNA-binding LacI/PurR family transcriptional regulator